MFETFVTGLVADRLGIVRQCIACRAAVGVNTGPCPGFGPGCLVTPRGGSRAEASDAQVTLHAAWGRQP